MNTLIGSTGFIGSFLRSVQHFDAHIHRANAHTLKGRTLDRVVCAGLPAAKWLANRDPATDLANMQALCAILRTVQVRHFVLISTVDVYATPVGLDENYACSSDPSHHPYGAHRLQFEQFVRRQFPTALIVRLPALFGPGLKKNVLFDLMHDHCLDAVQPISTFQWYPLTELPAHIQRCEQAGLSLVNLCPEPIATREIIDRFFPGKRIGDNASPPVRYDLRSRHADFLGGSGGYVFNSGQVFAAMQAFTRRVA